MDSQSETSQIATLQDINQEHAASPAITTEYLLDYDALIARYGRTRWHDERKWLTMRMPIAADSLIHLANEWLRFIHPLTGKVCKVLVTDLDNTLWGGVIGEDGLKGIQIGAEYPGASYRALQRAMLDLFHGGIILAICSRNNPSDALEVLEHHPGMLLRPHRFPALQINWDEKVQNLRQSPPSSISAQMPSPSWMIAPSSAHVCVITELTIIDMPDDPMAYAKTLREHPVFERLGLSVEDRERGRY